MSSVYEYVTKRIIKKLEEGVVPWRRPWINGVAVNYVTQKPYKGINSILLDGGEYATFKQIKDAGGTIKKSERKKSDIIVFWKLLEQEDEDGEIKKIPFLRYSRVFEINSQVDGLNSKRKEETFNHDLVNEGEKIIKGYINSPSYSFYSGKAYYRPREDRINVPPLKDFQNPDKYYSTMFHEMIHSTGHQSRLNREGITKSIIFGDENYSKEELVAELGAAMLCSVAGIDNSTIDNSASYIQSWLRALENDQRLIVYAASKAQKAADYILNKKDKNSSHCEKAKDITH